jgi:hypothetical protein
LQEFGHYDRTEGGYVFPEISPDWALHFLSLRTVNQAIWHRQMSPQELFHKLHRDKFVKEFNLTNFYSDQYIRNTPLK